jgi:hypothetical protein
MARQFREQLEEEVQLEEARKTQRATSPPPVEPVSAAAPRVPANGGGSGLTETSYAHHPQPGDHVQPAEQIQPAEHTPPAAHVQPTDQTAGAPGTEPTGARPAQAGGADERRT